MDESAAMGQLRHLAKPRMIAELRPGGAGAPTALGRRRTAEIRWTKKEELASRTARSSSSSTSVKNITQFFKQDLAAPLHNQQWSWGAANQHGQVFLRVWQKDWKHKERLSLVIGPNWKPRSAGHNERMRQLEMIEGGAPGFLVVCDGHFDDANGKMVIESYRDDVVFPIAAIERDGEWIHARWTDPVPIGSVRTVP